MYEFTIVNKITGINEIEFGYNEKDMWRRSGLNAEEWSIILIEYID